MRQSAASPASAETRLQGHWLLLARITFGAAALLSIWLFTLGLVLSFDHLNSLSDAPNGWSAAAFQTALAQLGLSVSFYHLYLIVVNLIFALCFFLVAALLLWRKSNEWMALFVALVLIIFGAIWPTNLDGLAALYPAWSWLFTIANQLSLTFLAAFFFLFPDGRFVPRWMRWLVIGWIGSGLLQLFVPGLPDALGVLLFFGSLALVLLAQIYRYRRHASPVQRQQIKWVVFGFGVTLSATLGYLALEALFPVLDQPGPIGVLYNMAGFALGNSLFLQIPLCVGIALLRHRLWDIDSIINKTLVYGLLTALLAALYAGLIIGLTSLVGAISEQTSQPIVLVISTLAIAALVLPLRRRIQSLIDRRFYRKKYDAEKTLAAFSASLRSEVNLEQVQQQLLAVVQETMQPAHISLWLRPPDHAPRRRMDETVLNRSEGKRS